MSQPALIGLLAVSALLAAGGASAQQPAPPRRLALVIGVNGPAIRVENVATLKWAQNDAKEVGRILSEVLKWDDVRPLIDHYATRDAIVRELTRLAREAHPQDLVLVYFAGHGIRQKWAEEGGKPHTYWVVYNTTLPNLELDALRLEHLMDYVDDIPARQKVVILDHCHSGTVELRREGQGPAGGNRDVEAGVAAVKRGGFVKKDFEGEVERRAREATLVVGAALDPESFEADSLEHGVFTKALLEALSTTAADRDGDFNLSADELVKYLAAQVPKLATVAKVRQTPIAVTGGDVLGWNLLVLARDPGREVEVLQELIGRLAARNLKEPIREACMNAVRQWADMQKAKLSPAERDEKIVKFLQGIQRKAAPDLKAEAISLTGLVNELDKP